MKERDIMHEAGSYWVGRTATSYTVYRAGVTHSTPDSSYPVDPDGLSVAIARCKYLASRPPGFTLTRTLAGGYSATIPPGPEPDREILRHAVEAFGHLVGRGSRLTGPELAQRIRNVYTHPRAAEVAAILERY